jgi:cupin 2 domain-containing protein
MARAEASSTMRVSGSLFSELPTGPLDAERMEDLHRAGAVRIERIVSTGQATPAGAWFDQRHDEWVVLLKGGAGLLLEGEAGPRTLAPGDWVLLPAGLRHRVEWTAPGEATVWLAVHIGLAPHQKGE